MSELKIGQIGVKQLVKLNESEIIKCETEYLRYDLYCKLVQDISKGFIVDKNPNFQRKKIYECKNIIDRYILECINDGVVTRCTSITHNNVKIDILDYEDLSRYIFFNNKGNYTESIYYTKMLNEFAEKRITFKTGFNIGNTIEYYSTKFRTLLSEIEKGVKATGELYNKGKWCDFTVENNNSNKDDTNVVVFTYKNYTKKLSIWRFLLLVKNFERPSLYDVARMLLRYAIFDNSNQQWSIGVGLYEFINTNFDICFEMFASPLNFNMKRYCTIFLDSDSVFGSIGNFYTLNCDTILNNNIRGVFYNPPYLPLLMSKTIDMCLNLLDVLANSYNYEFSIFAFLPYWSDAEYINNIMINKYVVSSKVFKRGEFVLHEKDKGKVIKGTFDLVVIFLNNKWEKMGLKEQGIKQYKELFDDVISYMHNEVEELEN